MTFETKSNCLIIHLSGEIDHHSAEESRNKIDREFESSLSRYMIFDFSGVDFMDSAGIGLIIGRYKAVDKQGGKVAVTGVSSAVNRILDISGIYKIIQSFPSAQDAVTNFSGGLL